MAGTAGRRARRLRSLKPFTAAHGRRLFHRAHRLHRRGWLRNHACRPTRAGRILAERFAAAGVKAVRTRRARHAAARSGHESVRAGHGRGRQSARVRSRLDRRSGECARLRGQVSAACTARPRGNWSACFCRRQAACCAAIRRFEPSPATGEITSGTYSPTLGRRSRWRGLPIGVAAGRSRARRRPRQAAGCARSQAAVRAQRQEPALS